MAGLFTTPQQVMQAETMARSQQATQQHPLAGQFFNLGFQGANAFQRGVFGTDTRSQAQIAAGNMQQQLQGLDFTNRNSVLTKVQQLNQAGMHSQAAELMKMVPDVADVEETFGEPVKRLISVTDDTGNITNQTVLMQQSNKTGAWKRVADVTSSGQFKEPTTTEKSKFKPAKIDFDKLDVETQYGFLSNLPGVEGEGYFFDNYTIDDAKPIIGDMERLATELKNRDKLRDFRAGGDGTSIAVDPNYILKAQQLMMEDPQAWYNPSSIGKGSKVRLRSNSRVTIDSLLDKKTKREKVEQAEQVAGQVNLSRDVRPSETQGVFDPAKLNRQQAFKAMEGIKSPQDLINNLQGQGWNLTQSQQMMMEPFGEALVSLPTYARGILLGGPAAIENERIKLKSGDEDQGTLIQKLIILNQLEKINYGR